MLLGQHSAAGGGGDDAMEEEEGWATRIERPAAADEPIAAAQALAAFLQAAAPQSDAQRASCPPAPFQPKWVKSLVGLVILFFFFVFSGLKLH